MKKLTLVLISAIIFCFCFSACGKKDKHDYDAVIVNENYAYNSAFVCFDSPSKVEAAYFYFEVIVGTQLNSNIGVESVNYSAKNSDGTTVNHDFKLFIDGVMENKIDGYFYYELSMKVQVDRAETPQNENIIFDNFEFAINTNKTHNVKIENVKFYLDVYYVNEKAFNSPFGYTYEYLDNTLSGVTAIKSITVNRVYTDGQYVKSAELLEEKTDLLKDRQLDSFRANLEFIPEKFDMVCGYLIAEYTYYGDDNVMTAPIYNFYYKKTEKSELTCNEIIAKLPK